MSYCTVDNVETLVGQEYGAGTRPTRTEVGTLCENISAELDGVLAAAGYSTPVAASASLTMLRHYATMGTAVQAWHAGYITDADYPRIQSWQTAYRDFLLRIRKGEQWLPDVTPASEMEAAFAVAAHPQRDAYWTTGQALDA